MYWYSEKIFFFKIERFSLLMPPTVFFRYRSFELKYLEEYKLRLRYLQLITSNILQSKQLGKGKRKGSEKAKNKRRELG